MSDRDALLFANEAFYRAFADRDAAAIDAVWATRAPVACIHPGWGVVEGRAEVMKTWAAIVANPDSPAIVCRGARAYPHGDAGFVVCYERIGGQYLTATNLFVREGRMWKMVHHQAGPTSGAPASEAEDDPGPVN